MTGSRFRSRREGRYCTVPATQWFPRIVVQIFADRTGLGSIARLHGRDVGIVRSYLFKVCCNLIHFKCPSKRIHSDDQLSNVKSLLKFGGKLASDYPLIVASGWASVFLKSVPTKSWPDELLGNSNSPAYATKLITNIPTRTIQGNQYNIVLFRSLPKPPSLMLGITLTLKKKLIHQSIDVHTIGVLVRRVICLSAFAESLSLGGKFNLGLFVTCAFSAAAFRSTRSVLAQNKNADAAEYSNNRQCDAEGRKDD